MKKKRRKKPKYRLKESAKRFLIYFSVSALLLLYGTIKCTELIKDYQYHQTHEYKLLTIGYTEEETERILNNIDEKYIDKILEEEKKNEFYSSLTKEKYYIKENYEKYLNYYQYHKTTDIKEIIGIINTNSNQEWYTNIKNVDTTKNPILINKYNIISEEYEAQDIIKINLQTSYSNNSANKEVIDAYYEMHEAVKTELNVNLMVVASYRSYKNQAIKYAEYKKVSLEYADTFCERPGHSEHQTGLALDLVSLKNYTQKTFLESEEYKWLQQNAYKYGFIIRYPNEKYKITGYKEPNHFRYVGKDIAKIIHEENITLEEYYAFYIAK